MSNGLVTQIIGAVIDVEFDKTNIPNVYEALTISGMETVLEVQQQLGDGVVRTIAMGSTEGPLCAAHGNCSNNTVTKLLLYL